MSLRRSGYNKVAVNLLDLSTIGFRIETFGGIGSSGALLLLGRCAQCAPIVILLSPIP